MNKDLKDVLKNGLGGVVTIVLLGALVYFYGAISNNLSRLILFLNEKQFSVIHVIIITLLTYPVVVFLVDKINTWMKFSTKEILGGQLNQGESLNYETKKGQKLKFQLDDISPNEGLLRISRAIISVLDKNGNILDRFKASQDSKKRLLVNNEEIKIKIGEITAGYSFGSKWIEISILE